MAPPPPPAAAAPAAGGTAAVFAELNRGADVTKGLRKVDKSEMTHKNPSLRAGSTVPSTLGSDSKLDFTAYCVFVLNWMRTRQEALEAFKTSVVDGQKACQACAGR